MKFKFFWVTVLSITVLFCGAKEGESQEGQQGGNEQHIRAEIRRHHEAIEKLSSKLQGAGYDAAEMGQGAYENPSDMGYGGFSGELTATGAFESGAVGLQSGEIGGQVGKPPLPPGKRGEMIRERLINGQDNRQGRLQERMENIRDGQNHPGQRAEHMAKMKHQNKMQNKAQHMNQAGRNNPAAKAHKTGKAQGQHKAAKAHKMGKAQNHKAGGAAKMGRAGQAGRQAGAGRAAGGNRGGGHKAPKR